MAEPERHTWWGESGRGYTYWAHSPPTPFADVAGNYIFAKRAAGQWQAVYIGEAESLRNRLRLEDHEKWPCAELNGATHIHAHATRGGREARLAEETDLVRRWTPPCND